MRELEKHFSEHLNLLAFLFLALQFCVLTAKHSVSKLAFQSQSDELMIAHVFAECLCRGGHANKKREVLHFSPHTKILCELPAK